MAGEGEGVSGWGVGREVGERDGQGRSKRWVWVWVRGAVESNESVGVVQAASSSVLLVFYVPPNRIEQG